VETPLTLTFHGIQITISIATLLLLAPLLKQYKIWNRIKDRVNTLWQKHCEKTGDRFVSLDGNGH
jgi:hypothetical protein